jgi:CubicO group peptidase (beta-lactamase class C family)
VTTESSAVLGTVAPQYDAVKTAFEATLASGLEKGGHFAVFRNGSVLVDIWGGLTADGTKAIKIDCLYSVFSASKALSSLCVAMLVDRGKLDYEAPVANYWPEFACRGKSGFSIGHLMSHQVGLMGVSAPTTIEDFYGHDRVAALLADQKPDFGPGYWGYHPLTFGTLADEIVRRSDGRTMSQFFNEELGAIAGGDAYLGLPQEADHRHSGVERNPDLSTPQYDSPMPGPFMNSMTNPPIDADWGNQRIFRAAGQPGAGASANARGLARIFASMLDTDAPLISLKTFTEASCERIVGIDRGSGGIGRYAAGFRLNVGTMGSNPDAFGHAGLGGSVVFVDPARRWAVAYTTCRVINPSWQGIDPRLAILLRALYECEGKLEGGTACDRSRGR